MIARLLRQVACAGITAALLPIADATETQASPSRAEAFAVVDGVRLGQQVYDRALASAIRTRFYHGAPPEPALAGLRREVAESLVDRTLLLAEARRRGIEPEGTGVEQALREIDARYGSDPRWRIARARELPILRAELEDGSRLKRLEREIRDVPPPDERAARRYYLEHPDVFTEPERVRLSVILLKVDPAAPAAAWQEARNEAEDILRRLRAGADFSSLARLHSGDAASAERGGDMGYLHKGMLPEGLQRSLDELEPGELSAPVTLLEGIAVFRLEARQVPRLSAFEQARERAAGLERRAEADQRWAGLVAGLRRKAVIDIDWSKYPGAAASENRSGVR